MRVKLARAMWHIGSATKLHLMGEILCVIFVAGHCLVSGVQERQAGKSCLINGKIVGDGVIFNLTATGPCVTHECRNGEVFPNSYGCQRDGKCYPLGDKYNVGCIQKQCSLSNGNFDYVRVNEGCTFKDICLSVDQIHEEGCFKYKCTKGGSPVFTFYSVDLVEWGCNYQGKCHPGNTTLTKQCTTMECQNIKGVVGFRNVDSGCQFNSQCLKVGETVVENCRTFKCRQEDINGTPLYSMDPVSTKCQDSSGNCRDPGTTFPYTIGTVTRPNCTCKVQGLQVQYSC